MRLPFGYSPHSAGIEAEALPHHRFQQQENFLRTAGRTRSQRRCANALVVSRESPNQRCRTFAYDSQIITMGRFRQTLHSPGLPTVQHKFSTMIVGAWTAAFATPALNNFQTCTFFCTSVSVMPTVVTEFCIPLSLSALPIAIGRVVHVLLLTTEGSGVESFSLRRSVVIGLAVVVLLFLSYSSFAISLIVLLRCSCHCKTNPKISHLTHWHYTWKASGSLLLPKATHVK